FVWGPSQDLAFRTLKAMMAEQTQLQIFDPDSEIFVTTDASDVGNGALLSQRRSPQDPERPIAFFNKTLDGPERNYGAGEREALACVKAIEHWENLLLGLPFKLRTDHKSLTAILGGIGKNRRQTSKYVRWKERLEAFDFSVEYIPGPHNQVADYLSRLHAWAAQLGVKTLSETPQVAATLQDLQAATQADPDLQRVVDAVKSGTWTKLELSSQQEMAAFKSVRAQLSVDNGI
ncbi:MAG: hypothetical protein GY930_14460, partial [bacterium]|nr:hypothetical protein [bacterium]